MRPKSPATTFEQNRRYACHPHLFGNLSRLDVLYWSPEHFHFDLSLRISENKNTITPCDDEYEITCPKKLGVYYNLLT